MARHPAAKLEVHEHSFITGPRANKEWLRKLVHSHPGGDVPHKHPETGCGSYTIDKDEWFRATGLRGGGRKKFTVRPSGEQLPAIPRTAEENSFEIVVAAPDPDQRGAGPGIALPMRLILALGMRVSAVRRA
jgi:hypothetical protein